MNDVTHGSENMIGEHEGTDEEGEADKSKLSWFFNERTFKVGNNSNQEMDSSMNNLTNNQNANHASSV